MSTATLDKCPNCNKSLKGIFKQTAEEQSIVDFINKHLNKDFEAYCSHCAPSLLDEITWKYTKLKNEIEAELQQIIHKLPLLTAPAPANWQYEVNGMVTAQTTAGTGFVTELSRSFNDFFGQGSNTTNKKISDAIKLCQADLRIQCAREGGNAIVGAQLSLSEIGSGSTNMLMVCIAGTSIKISDLAVLSEKQKNDLNKIIELTEHLDAIAEMDHKSLRQP